MCGREIPHHTAGLDCPARVRTRLCSCLTYSTLPVLIFVFLLGMFILWVCGTCDSLTLHLIGMVYIILHEFEVGFRCCLLDELYLHTWFVGAALCTCTLWLYFNVWLSWFRASHISSSWLQIAITLDAPMSDRKPRNQDITETRLCRAKRLLTTLVNLYNRHSTFPPTARVTQLHPPSPPLINWQPSSYSPPASAQ